MIKEKKANCTFCSLCCGMTIAVEDGHPAALDYDFDNPINSGSLCPRGNYMLELLANPARLDTPKIKANGSFYNSSFERAFSAIAQKISDIKRSHGSAGIGVVLGANLLSEDLIFAHKVFKSLGIGNIDVAVAIEDSAALYGDHLKMPFNLKDASIKDIGEQEGLIIIGDILTRSPVLSRRINKIKYSVRGSKVIVIDPEKSHTSWFATKHLQVKPGTESILLAGLIKVCFEVGAPPNIRRLAKYLNGINLKWVSQRTGIEESQIVACAKEFSSLAKGMIIVSAGFCDKLLMPLAKMLAAASNKSVIAFYSSGNSVGSWRIKHSLISGRSLSLFEMIKEAEVGRLKALLLFGVDILRSLPQERTKRALSNLEFVSVADLYKTSTMDYADVILPLSSHLEQAGSMVCSPGRAQEFSPVVLPAGSLSLREMAKGIYTAAKGPGKKELKLSVGEIKGAAKAAKADKFLVQNISQDLKAIKPARKIENFAFSVHLKDDIVHSSDGSITSKHYWAGRECSSPYVELNCDDALSLGVKAGDRVLVKTLNGEVVLNVKLSRSFDRGVAAMPHHFPEVRELVLIAEDQKTGSFEVAPARAAIERIG